MCISVEDIGPVEVEVEVEVGALEDIIPAPGPEHAPGPALLVPAHQGDNNIIKCLIFLFDVNYLETNWRCNNN